MGRITTPKYRIELSCIHFGNKRKEWHSFSFSGKPTENSAKNFRDLMNESMKAGGTNEHLNKLMSLYGRARVIEQKTNLCVAEYNPPMFEVIN